MKTLTKLEAQYLDRQLSEDILRMMDERKNSLNWSEGKTTTHNSNLKFLQDLREKIK